MAPGVHDTEIAIGRVRPVAVQDRLARNVRRRLTAEIPVGTAHAAAVGEDLARWNQRKCAGNADGDCGASQSDVNSKHDVLLTVVQQTPQSR
jgi:hypothetical protein